MCKNVLFLQMVLRYRLLGIQLCDPIYGNICYSHTLLTDPLNLVCCAVKALTLCFKGLSFQNNFQKASWREGCNLVLITGEMETVSSWYTSK